MVLPHNAFLTSKSFCDTYIAPASYQTQAIDITLTYNDGTGGSTPSPVTTTITENGQNQIISLTGFDTVPMGDQSILITKSGTNDIYPRHALDYLVAQTVLMQEEPY